jgi:signal peptidase I
MTEPLPTQAAKAGPETKTSQDSGLWETVKVVLQALAIALIVRTVLFQPFNIPSASLVPTLLVGDYLFVSKYTYGYSKHSIPFSPDIFSGRIFGAQPKRGDIVVFKLPRDGSTDYIKRLIGLPGDKIQMIDGRLYINGKQAPREEITPYVGPNDFGIEGPIKTYHETLPDDKMQPNGVVHRVIEKDGDRGTLDNTQVFEVPAGNYFMMGDNRDNSTDSRVPRESGVGFVPFENLVGRAEIIFFSIKTKHGANGQETQDTEPAWQFWRWPWTVRWDRLFQTVR